MRLRILCGLIGAVVAGGAVGCDEVSFPVLQVDETFGAALSGTDRVPPVTTTATGTAVLALVQDSFLTWRVDLAYPDTAALVIKRAHIHAGLPGANGATVLTLLNLPGTRTLRSFAGQVSAGQIKASVLDTAAVRFDSLLVLIRGGNAYVDVHAVADSGPFPGMVRGQIQVQ